ncbi:hypothetical protein ACFLQV_04310 [Calditrichota bacterium]
MIDTKAIFKIPPKFVTNSKGKRTEVILDIKTYEKLIEQLEDVIDTQIALDTMDEETIDWEDAKRELKAAGKL